MGLTKGLKVSTMYVWVAAILLSVMFWELATTLAITVLSMSALGIFYLHWKLREGKRAIKFRSVTQRNLFVIFLIAVGAVMLVWR